MSPTPAEKEKNIRSDDDLAVAIENDHRESVHHVADYHEEWADNFLFHYKFDHYEDEHANTRDRRRVKPKGRQSASKHRHKLAQIMRQSHYITTRPVDMFTDPAEAASARWWLEYEINDPQKRFKRKLRRAYSLAMACGAGAIRLVCRYDLGPYPVIMPQVMDPRCITWTPGFQDPDDIETPEVYFEDWYTPEQIEAMSDFGWKNTKDPRPDDIARGDGRSFDRLTPITTRAGNPGPRALSERNLVRVLTRMSRFDRTRKKVNAEMDRVLPPAEWYMACPECGYQERFLDGSMLPRVSPSNCPACGQHPLMRVERERPIEDLLLYPNGCRQTIIAPGQERKIFYDGPWMHALNGRPPRNIPAAFFRCYDIPLEPWGSSDTAWDWPYQVIANSIMRRGWEQMSRGGSMIVTSGELTKYGSKQPFEFSDKPLSLARWRGQGEPQVKFFQPEGLPRNFVEFKQAVDQDFRGDMGFGDVSLSKDQMKGVNVGTIMEARQSGELPVDDQAEQFRENLTPLFGTWYDMKRAVMTERQATQVRGPDGGIQTKNMRGEDLPNLNVIVAAQPTWDAYDAEKGRSLQELLQSPPEAIGLIGEANNLDPELVAKAQQVAMAIASRMNPQPNPNAKPPAKDAGARNPGAGRAPAMNGA